MKFSSLAQYLIEACDNAIATELKDVGTGTALNDSITDDDCEQVASAIAAVEMMEKPNCDSPPPSSSSSARSVKHLLLVLELAPFFLTCFLWLRNFIR